MSLGDPDISQSIRIDVQKDYAQAKQRISEIDRQLREAQTLSSNAAELVNLESVAERLERLGGLLDGENASAINIALAQHIESIRCDPEGKVRLRMCTLGALANPLEIAEVAGLLPPAAADPLSQPTANPRRRRTRRDVGEASGDFKDLDLANDMAVTVDRFEGLGDEWFTVDEFVIERHTFWAHSKARAVAEYRLRTGATMEKTTAHFGRSIPTIRAALRYAKEQYGLDALGKTLSQATWATWSRLNARRVVAFLAQPGATKESAARHFGKSVPTIEAAKNIATETQPPEANATGSD